MSAGATRSSQGIQIDAFRTAPTLPTTPPSASRGSQDRKLHTAKGEASLQGRWWLAQSPAPRRGHGTSIPQALGAAPATGAGGAGVRAGTHVSGEVVKAEHHDQHHCCHGVFGGHQGQPAKQRGEPLPPPWSGPALSPQERAHSHSGSQGMTHVSHMVAGAQGGHDLSPTLLHSSTPCSVSYRWTQFAFTQI